MKYILHFIAFSLSFVGCQPPQPMAPQCRLSTELPRIVPMGATDCGDGSEDSLLSRNERDVAVGCANNAIQNGRAFALRVRGYAPSPTCPDNADCPLVVVLKMVFVGVVADGSYRIRVYTEGRPGGAHRTPAEDAGIGEPNVPLTVVKRECQPQSDLRSYLPGTSLFSVACSVTEGTSAVELLDLPRVASCPAP